jgi:hypothetical protein
MQITQDGQIIPVPEGIISALARNGMDTETKQEMQPPLHRDVWYATEAYQGDGDPKGLQAEYLAEQIARSSPSFGTTPRERAARWLEAVGAKQISGEPDEAARRAALKKLGKKARRARNPRHARRARELIRLFEESRQLCGDGSRVVDLDSFAEVRIVGDLHGGWRPVKRITGEIGSRGQDSALVYLGDFPNNGFQSAAVLRHVLTQHINDPNRVFLLAGNHETAETLATAIKEMFKTHWDHALKLRKRQFPPKRCYGHLLLDLIGDFGYDLGTEVYEAFAIWAAHLPCAARFGKTLMSHSLGLPESYEAGTLIHSIPSDEGDLRRLGYEEWKRRKSTLRAAMVNTRDFREPGLIDKLKTAFDVERFVVGHSHYRSGVVLSVSGSDIVTVCSSDSTSPDAGHYMAWEYEHERGRLGPGEGLGSGPARPVYLKVYKNGSFELVRVPAASWLSVAGALLRRCWGLRDR